MEVQPRSGISFIFILIVVAAVGAVLPGCAPAFKVSESSLSSLSGDDLGGGSLDKACNVTDPGQTVLRRLSNDELKYSFKDLLGAELDVSALPSDDTSTDGFNNNGDLLGVHPDYLEKLIQASTVAIANAVAKTPALIGCQANKADQDCARDILGRFARKAFRRPLAAAETDTLVTQFKSLMDKGLTRDEALSGGIQRILLSPHFLYRTSFGSSSASVAQDTTTAIRALTQHELATRLAYFLWLGPPDDRLLTLADDKKLEDPAVLEAELARMLKDPKAVRFKSNFVSSWLGLQAVLSPTVVSREGLTEQIRKDMLKEAELFFASVVDENKSPLELVSANYTFMNQSLASVYGIDGISGSQFQRVSLENSKRRGLLTQLAFLTINSAPEMSKPTARGNKILQNVVCAPPPPFPDGLGITPIDQGTTELTMRERMELHRKSPVCAGCHKEMDPIGLGLENFDQFGRFRSTYSNGLSIDASGTLRGKQFRHSDELLALIINENDYKKCLSKKLLTFAVGRALKKEDANDACAAQMIGQAAVQADKSFSQLLLEVIRSPQFRLNNTDSRGVP